MKKVQVLNLAHINNNSLSTDFYVDTLENHLVNAQTHINRPHKHDFYVCVIFTAGNGTHEIDFETYNVQPGSVFFISPGQIHSWQLSENISGFIFFHTQAFLEQNSPRYHTQTYPFYSLTPTNPSLYLTDTKIGYFKNLFYHLLQENQAHKLLKFEKIQILIQLIYVECAREYLTEVQKTQLTQNTYSRQFNDFQLLVEQHYKTEKSATFYAEKLNISTKHLNRICQHVLGKTTTEYIINRVLLEAKREIIYQKNTLTQIAYLLGYEDYAYFSRIFKKHFNETPSEFINKYR